MYKRYASLYFCCAVEVRSLSRIWWIVNVQVGCRSGSALLSQSGAKISQILVYNFSIINKYEDIMMVPGLLYKKSRPIYYIYMGQDFLDTK